MWCLLPSRLVAPLALCMLWVLCVLLLQSQCRCAARLEMLRVACRQTWDIGMLVCLLPWPAAAAWPSRTLTCTIHRCFAACSSAVGQPARGRGAAQQGLQLQEERLPQKVLRVLPGR